MRFIFVLSFLFYWSAISYSQIDSHEVWLDSKQEYKLNKKLDLSLNESFRSRISPFSAKSLIIELSAEYEISKVFKTGLKFRHGIKLNNNADIDRISIYLRAKERYKKFNFSWRGQYQREYESFESFDSNFIRNKFSISYSRKKIDFKPSLFFEIFYNPNHSVYHWDQRRLGGGMEYALNKKQSITAKCFIKNALNESRWKRTIVYRLSYSIELN